MAEYLSSRCDLLNRVLLSFLFVFLLVVLPWSWASPSPAGQAHPNKGPYGGLLMEVGHEEYHVEVLLNEKTNILTVYVLDATGKVAVPINAKDVLITLKRNGKPEQFVLPAVRFTTDPARMASQFQLRDEALIDGLHQNGNDARLVLEIRGKSYIEKFDLKHDHGRKS